MWVAFAQVYARMIRLTITDPTHSDFTIFYYTSRMVADGLPMYGVSPARYGVTWAADHLGNLNPPHVQLLLLPLGHLSYRAALAWFVADQRRVPCVALDLAGRARAEGRVVMDAILGMGGADRSRARRSRPLR